MCKAKILLLIITCCILTSCFKEEPLNAECDIEKAYVHVGNPETMFFNASDSMVSVPYTDSTVIFNVRKQADVSAMAPKFQLTAGATISPDNGSVHDFTKESVNYTVTSEDGKWHRSYMVSFNQVIKTINDTITYNFESYELETQKQKYYVWHNERDDGTLGNDWATGNSGFNLSRGSAKPDEYPTTPLTEGYEGSAVCLTTCDTGPFGAMVNKRLAAGNLFLGTFDLTSALKDAMKATLFGIQFDKKPIKITGYYKYAPGATFQDPKGNVVANRVDSAAIYAVLYRNHDADGNAVVLYGDNVKTSNLIVALADMEYVKPTDQWTPFEISFNYQSALDETLLENRGYSFTVVFSSSKEGDKFEGAIGSKLLIDKVKVICTEEK
ncbi:MAG: PCMD domain-containing protein [Muribaculaceae bacterium]|jgi:hypothetical protein|nr:PCMD domain-containing protein [Muribaculaceae bacterium]